MQSIVRRLALVALVVLVAGATADAASFTATTTGLNSLDHNYAYVWRIGGLDIDADQVTSASIAVNDLRNWDRNANTLHVWLFDSARTTGVRSTWDGEAGMSDFFIGPLSTTLFTGSTLGLSLTSASGFGTTATDWSYTFTAPQLAALGTYAGNDGIIAIALDPDCHYYANGLTFSMETQAVPEPASMVLLGSGLLGLAAAVRRRRQR